MEQLVSIIIPVYKVEDVIRRCIKSVVDQTHTNIEIIIVDDGSPDCSGAICDSLAKDDDRIKVFHIKNSGVSYARNFGIQKAKGEVVAFVDSDDIIMPTYISTLIEMMERNDADISCCAFRKFYDETETKSFGCNMQVKEMRMSGRDACFELFGTKCSQMVAPWCKLIKKSLVLDNMFPVGRRHEDSAVAFKWFYNSKTVCICDAELYLYYQNPNGFMKSVEDVKNEDRKWAHMLQAEFFEGQGEKTLAKLAWRKALLSLYVDSMRHDGRSDNDLADCLNNDKYAKHIYAMDKLKYSAYLLCPKLYKCCRGILKTISTIME